MAKTTLHFSLGPVQGFVAQARRTRDFWAGSFLLSYLAGQAIDHIIRNGGEIVFPAVKDTEGRLDPLLQAIQIQRNGSSVKDGPIIGTLPNRFQARVSIEFEPDACVAAVENAWQRIAEQVYERYVLPVEDAGCNTRSIWNRQIQGFWNIVWALGEEEDLLERRKNWRSHVPPEEPGDKCTVMGNMQEISGFIRIKQKKQQNKFWEQVRNRARVSSLDLRDNERLCAVAMVKRFFPQVAQKTIGWPVAVSFPSTVYMSAVPWMANTLEKNQEFTRDFAVRATKIPHVQSEYRTNIDCLEKLAGIDSDLKEFITLAGNCFFVNMLENDSLWGQGTEIARNELIKMLRGQEVSPFYAFLLMDGDRMGTLLQDYSDDKRNISLALNAFSHQVEEVVKSHNGITIYAGGDDVLALLPLDDALRAGAALREKYREAFRAIAPGVLENRATISAAIVYAHNHAPLKLIFQYAQELLSQKAKEETGRDAVAISAWKTGGPVLNWAVPWQVIIQEDGTNLFEKLVQDFSGSDREEKKFSSSFFYNLRKRFSLMAQDEWLSGDKALERLLGAEYMRSRDKISKDAALVHMRDLLKILHVYRRREDGQIDTIKKFNVDGALLVKFLATKGVNV
ncbi:MAG: type III-B CRISPR-associated protein Cas10/Cmr2 [Syntrophomonadaceae bacterium]|nr:type III-B CRISPR-associated protein Cas10/Cmr2 [Syntrophomonadaceae bacterium]